MELRTYCTHCIYARVPDESCVYTICYQRINRQIRSNAVNKVPFLEDKSDFSNEIWEVGDKLTAIMDQMKEELAQKDDSTLRTSLIALAKAQGQLLKALSTFDDSFKVPLEAHETWQHFLAKNCLVTSVPRQNIFPEFNLGGCIVDVLIKINDDYVVIEAETNPTKCVEKVRKIKKALRTLHSERFENLDTTQSQVLTGIRNQLEIKRSLRSVFVLTRNPMTWTLESIKEEEDVPIRLEVYYVDTRPPFKVSADLLNGIQTEKSD